MWLVCLLPGRGGGGGLLVGGTLAGRVPGLAGGGCLVLPGWCAPRKRGVCWSGVEGLLSCSGGRGGRAGALLGPEGAAVPWSCASVRVRGVGVVSVWVECGSAGWSSPAVGVAGCWEVCPSLENCIVDASIFVAKLVRAHGGCLGTRSR